MSAGGHLDDDAELIGRARTGDAAAYETLVRRYQDVAMSTAYLVAPEADAADAVQGGLPLSGLAGTPVSEASPENPDASIARPHRHRGSRRGARDRWLRRLRPGSSLEFLVNFTKS